MTWIRVFTSRLLAFCRSRRLDRDLDEELRSHIEMETEANLQRGKSRQEARLEALREFGGLARTAELYRERRGLPRIETVLQDIRHALRVFRKAPGFTVVAILSLSLGIGVNTAIFSMVNALLLRPLPVKAPDRLVALSMLEKGDTFAPLFSYPDYREIQEQATGAFSGILAYWTGIDGLSLDGRADRIVTHYVTGNYFTVLGVTPALGRLILPTEGEVAGADPVIVLNYSYWATRFAGDTKVIGKRVLINGHPVTVVGVAPRGFHGAQAMLDVQGYLPLAMNSISTQFLKDFKKNRRLRNLNLLGRLRPGVTLTQARAALEVVAARLAAVYPKDFEGAKIGAQREALGRIPIGGSEALVGASAVFLALAALVLLLACVNLANLLMVRAAARQKEMAVRAALGGSRSRLARQFLTETFLLAFLGAAGGLLLGAWTCRGLTSLRMQGIPIHLDFSLDGRVFAYAFGAAALTGLPLGLAPALRAVRVDLSAALAGSSRDAAKQGPHRMGSALVVAQIAASFLLLIFAVLLARTLQNARRIDLGFDPRNVVNFSMDPHHIGYDEAQGRQFYRELLDRVRALPGVESAGIAFAGPMSAFMNISDVRVDGFTPARGQSTTAFSDVVSRDFFQTLRMPIVRGRPFNAGDSARAPRVAVVNQTMVERFWPGKDPVGGKFQILDQARWISLQVVGVLKDSRYLTLSEPRQPYFFLPMEQNYVSAQTLRVRSSGAPQAMMAEVQKEIEALAPGLPLAGVETMVQHLDSSLELIGSRVEAWFAAVLGGLGLALALLGLYGVMSYSAAQKTREIGIRLALGARRKDIRTLVLRRGVVMVGIGLPAGLLLSLGAAPIVHEFLLGVSATDPLTFVVCRNSAHIGHLGSVLRTRAPGHAAGSDGGAA